jgi:hypothetical protein
MAKEEVMRFRCTDIQRAVITTNAKREGSTLTDFILSRCLPETAESPHREVSTLPRSPVSAAPSGSISDLKARLGLKTAAEIETSGPATPPAEPPNRPARQMCAEDGSDLKRPFNPRRPDWYELIKRSDVYECVQDIETGQFFVQQGGRGREFPSQRAALEYCDSIDFA